MRKTSVARLMVVAVLCVAGAVAQDTPVYFAPEPGAAQTATQANGLVLGNAVVRVGVWAPKDGVQLIEFHSQGAMQPALVRLAPFTLLLGDGTVLPASAMKITTEPKFVELQGDAKAARLSERVPGKAVVTELADEQGRLSVTWRVILRDGSNYVRQEVTVAAGAKDVGIRELRLLDWQTASARVSGIVSGSPVVDGTLFAGFEDPLSACAVAGGRARCWIERELPLKAGQSVTYSSVIGVTAEGQMRRGFLHYVERERAHPYRPFLNYNSWYDLGFFSKYDEAGALAVINTFGTELTRKRGVPVESFLFDDGWDDPATLWRFNAGFPNGFGKLKETAASYGTAPGVWLSPWGGYGQPKRERVAAGQAAGYEIVNNGFALSGPKYYEAFRDRCFTFVREYGVNQFKFDGTGNANQVVKGSQFDSDFAAAIHLIGELRGLKPDLYVNLTTGTYPSPFWLRYADSVWRGGEDHEFLGVGPKREQWITYRDADTYERVVLSGPLFPLNSLMLHGMIYAKSARDLNTDPENSFRDEVRDYFGAGTQLQEMYITPSLLSQQNWDDLAEAAKWSRDNADVLVDTHWVGGDPALLEVYGWASWSPKKAVLVLRNPSDKPQTTKVDVAKALELPQGAKTQYAMRSPWKEDTKKEPVRLTGGQVSEFELRPFEVLVLEGAPVQ